MRVLWVCDYLSAAMRQLATCLHAQAGVQLSVAARWDGEPPLDQVAMSHLVCRHKFDFQARREIRSHVRAIEPDVIFAYTSRNLANTLAACRGLPPRVLGYRGTINRLRRLDPANWITFWHPRLDGVLCVCEATRIALEASGVPAEKLTTAWEGCASDPINVVDRSELARFDIPPDAFVVGTVANMRPVKGVDLLLRAAQSLSDLGVYWLLIGEVLDSSLPELAADPDLESRVRFAGGLPNAGRLVDLFDIYVAPSRMEGLSMGIMEAMAHGSCCLVTAVGGSPELIRSEVEGLVVPPEDPAALAESIRRLHADRDLRARLSAAARRRAESTFTIERWAERHLAAYRDVLARRM